MGTVPNPKETCPHGRTVPKESFSFQPHGSRYDGFLRLLPHIRTLAAVTFAKLGRERREDAVAEVVAAAFVMYRRLVDLGKPELAYPKPLTWFGIRRYRSGRRVGNGSGRSDVHSAQAQMKWGFEVGYLGTPFEQNTEWRESLVENRRTPVADQVQFRVDFGDWLQGLSRRDRRIAERLARGERAKDVAEKFGLSQARISPVAVGAQRRLGVVLGRGWTGGVRGDVGVMG